MDVTLALEEIRVLGALIEKDLTTPEYYPLTVNALINACNQKSNRDPVATYNATTVVAALDSLREKKLACLFSGAGSRATKYKHLAAETLALSREETALLAVLMLRGPQTVAELRVRTGRACSFTDAAQAEAMLEGLAKRETGALAIRLPRQPGQKECRYAHLFAGPPELAAGPAPGAAATAPPAPSPIEDERVAKLQADVEALRGELAELKRQFTEWKTRT